MMKTKKARRPMLLIFILIFVPAFVLSLSGCSRTPSPDENGQTILVCGFAQYDWVNNILGENPSGIAVERLNESSADMHSYQPTVADMVKIADCSLLIYTGGESEFWIDEAILSSGKTDSSCLSLMEIFEGPEKLCENYSDALSKHDMSTRPTVRMSMSTRPTVRMSMSTRPAVGMSMSTRPTNTFGFL